MSKNKSGGAICLKIDVKLLEEMTGTCLFVAVLIAAVGSNTPVLSKFPLLEVLPDQCSHKLHCLGV
jgi:hypothetical protein